MAKLTPKGAETRRRIVRAAAELMFRGGVAQTTMDDVRAAAGVSSSQIYHYFADKQALVHAVIEHQNDTVVGGQRQLLENLDTLAGLRAWRDAIVQLQHARQCTGGCPIGALGSELAEIDPSARIDVAAGFDRWEAGIRDGFRSMHERGDLVQEADPDRLASATLAALQGGLLLTQVRRSTVPLEDALDLVLAHLDSLTRR